MNGKYLLLCLALGQPFMKLSGQSVDLFVFIGQSNMAGRSEIGADTLALSNVFLLNAEGIFEPARNPLNLHSTIRKDKAEIQGLSPAYSFSKTYVESYGSQPIRILVQARGGTPIEKFLKGGNWGYYEATLNRIRNCLRDYPDTELRAIIFHQGESNRHNPEAYLPHLRRFIQDLRLDLGRPDLPFIFGEIGEWNTEYKGIREEMKKIPDILPGLYLVSSEGLTNKDPHHFDRASTLELGSRLTWMWVAVKNNPRIANRTLDTISKNR